MKVVGVDSMEPGRTMPSLVSVVAAVGPARLAVRDDGYREFSWRTKFPINGIWIKLMAQSYLKPVCGLREQLQAASYNARYCGVDGNGVDHLFHSVLNGLIRMLTNSSSKERTSNEPRVSHLL